MFTLSPKSGYEYLSNTCGATVSGNTMTISNVTSNKTCTVTFKQSATTLSSKILADNTVYDDNTTYMGWYRLYMNYWENGNTTYPRFACDTGPVAYGSLTVANYSLTYPVGLITADEMVYAGHSFQLLTNYTGSFLTNYLSVDAKYWTMTSASGE